MYDLTSELPAWAPYTAAGLGIAASFTLGVWIGRRRHRAHRAARGRRRCEDALTFVAAALATAVTSQGMWRVFEHRLHMPIELRGITFAFLEVAMLTCGIRARSNIADPEIGKAGPEGIAVWALASFSGLVSATDSKTWHEALIRLAAPLAAAWLWERGLHVQRTRNIWSRRRRWFSAIHWRITPERVLVALGLAEPQDRTAAEVDIDRRITRLAIATANLTMTRVRKRRIPGALRRARGRQQKAWLAALRHTDLAHDPELQARLDARAAALVHAAAFADKTYRPYWMPTPVDHDPRPRICSGAHAAPGLIRLRLRVPGCGFRTLHPLPTPGTEADPSASTVSLLARIREQRTDRRLGIPTESGEAPRTALLRTKPSPIARTTRDVRVYGAVRLQPVQALWAPPSAQIGIPAPSRTAEARTGMARTGEPCTVQPRRKEAPLRTYTIPARMSRTEQGTAPVPDLAADPQRTRDEWVNTLANEIRTAIEQGCTWRPDYRALMVRTRYRRSWCEKVVRDARALAAKPHTDKPRTDPPATPSSGT